MIFGLLITFFIHFLGTDGRVFCRDSNATPWRKNGYACPLRCENIVVAAEKLKSLDVDGSYESGKKVKIPENIKTDGKAKSTYRSNPNSLDKNEIHPIKIYNKRRMFHFGKGNRRATESNTTNQRNTINEIPENYEILHEELDNFITKEDEEEIRNLLEELQFEKEACKSLFNVPVFGKLKCTRKNDFEADLINKVSVILNSRVPGDKFDEDVIATLVKKALSVVLQRHGTLDVQLVLDFFKNALKGRASNTLPHIRLKSTYCLNMYVPGCYCKAGYVESGGQCVHPLECLTDPSLLIYSKKISVMAN